ncbi:uncharacterized protein LOC114289686 [Camellia sinensis]|uniref:uncharacterized protein LOC114289686 n=1 Tax=Camellia sinensis TaxID=4442 RepID=UPI001036D320|nr:uncharacterized protein LOC114289686 [Camellia sinensis]
MGDFECSICFLMKLLSWNIRGLGKAEKQGRIKKLLQDRHIDVAFFQETKKAVVSEITTRRLWGCRNMDYMSVDPEGTAGGLLCIWDPDVFQVSGYCCSRRYILLSGSLYNSFNCVLLNIYAPNEVNNRSIFGDNLIKLKVPFPNPWCLGGDFNEIRHMGERLISDHCPLLMKEDDRDWGPKPFRFSNAWTLHPTFPQLFVSSWTNATFSGWSGYILVQKLKHLKLTLKAWNTEVFGNISLKLKAFEEEIHALDIEAEERALQNLEKARRNVLQAESKSNKLYYS